MMLASIPNWPDIGVWPFGVQLLTCAFLSALLFLYFLWRSRVLSSSLGGKLLVFVFIFYIWALATVSGSEGSKAYILHFTSVPFLVSITMCVTKDASWAFAQWAAFFALALLFEVDLFVLIVSIFFFVCVCCFVEVNGTVNEISPIHFCSSCSFSKNSHVS